MRIAFAATDCSEHQRVGGGLAFSFGEGDMWSMAPHALYGIGHFGERAEIYIGGSAYLWLGERDDAFDADVEADVRLVVGLRF